MQHRIPFQNKQKKPETQQKKHMVWEDVKNQDDVEKYLLQKYPQYGDQLCKALAITIQKIVENPDDQTPELLQQFGVGCAQFDKSPKWDPTEEMEKLKQKGKEELAEKNARELLEQIDI